MTATAVFAAYRLDCPVEIPNCDRVPAFSKAAAASYMFTVGDSDSYPLSPVTPADGVVRYRVVSDDGAAGASGQSQTRQVTQAPSWLSVTAGPDGTPVLTGTPPADAVGTHAYRVIPTDDDGTPSDTTDDDDGPPLDITVVVSATDTAPSFSAASASYTFEVGESVNETLAAASGGNGTLSYSINPSIPVSGGTLTFSASTRALGGTAAVADRGTYTLTAEDIDGDTDTLDVTVTLTPEVSVTAGTSPVTEGTAATFTVERTGSTTNALTVDVDVERNGSFFTGTADSTIEILAGSSSRTLSVSTVGDSVDEPNGSVVVTIQAKSSYVVDSDSDEATVVVQDNDGTTPPRCNDADCATCQECSSPTGSCVAIDCGTNASCNNAGSCVCDSGYTGTPPTCTAVTPPCVDANCGTCEECSSPTGSCVAIDCGTNASCNNAGSCVCDSGYTGTPPNCTAVAPPCVDANCGTCEECSSPTGSCVAIDCGTNASCNNAGSCVCDSGYTGTPPNCTAVAPPCVDANCGTCEECSSPTGSCVAIDCGTNASCNNAGSCVCDSGYTGTPPNCTAVAPPCVDANCGTCEECSSPTGSCVAIDCGTNASCNNAGSCVCDSGYTGTPPNCTAVAPPCVDANCGTCEECSSPTGSCVAIDCGTNASCNNAGSCVCDSGYTGTPPNCTAVTPVCVDANCGDNARCVGNSCACNSGFTGTPPNCTADPVTCTPACTGGMECSGGTCACPSGTEQINGQGPCVAECGECQGRNLQGDCVWQCYSGEICINGRCGNPCDIPGFPCRRDQQEQLGEETSTPTTRTSASGQPFTRASGQPATTVTAGTSTSTTTVTAGGHLLGGDGAAVQIVVYEDFGCTFCREFGREVIPVLEEEYIDAGTVSLEYRHLAILGPESVSAAAAAECAADQDLFWPYHDLLVGETVRTYQEHARTLQATAAGAALNLETFDACVDAGTHVAAVQAATAQARDLLTGSGAATIAVPLFLVDDAFWRIGIPSMGDLRTEIARARTGSGDAATPTPTPTP